MAQAQTHLGQRARQWREAAGLSQAKVADMVGVCTKTISTLEKGQTRIMKATARKLEKLIATAPAVNPTVARPAKPAPKTQADPAVLSHSIALGPQRWASLTLPADLTQAEARRLASVLDSLATR